MLAVLAVLAVLAGCPRDTGDDVKAMNDGLLKSAAEREKIKAEGPAGDQRRALEAVRDNRKLFADCVRLARERMPTIEGRVVLDLTFNEEGAVALSKATVNETRDMKYALCVSAVAYQLKVPAPAAPPTQFAIGLLLGTDGALELASP